MRQVILAGLLLVASTPALACLPPPPGIPESPPPHPMEQARSFARWADTIVYGVVTRDSGDDDPSALFRVIHVYKGALKPGQVIRVSPSLRFSNLPCPGMFPPPPLTKSEYGVIAYSDEPEANWVSDDLFARLVSVGAIRPARGQRVGTGSAPE